MMSIGLVTLGCNKNQVDSEMLLGLFKKLGYNIVSNPEEADIIIVNTCGFINSAKKEAIDTLLEMADYKIYGKCKALIATGCLAKRYKKEILKEMPEVDLCIGVDEYNNIDKILTDFFKKNYLDQKLSFSDRIISSKFPLAYIRISDGCDNRCSYCAIPSIRGRFKSRNMDDILLEVENLAKQGFKEFCVISQDTSKYGLDNYKSLKLKELLNKMSKIDGVKWIRVLYMYPFETTDELIKEIIENEKICTYFDLPIQHASDKILKSMNRYDTNKIIYNTVEKIRKLSDDAIIRTTIMTGFPGESDEDFEILKKAVLDLKFDRLRGFTYSREEGTISYDFKDQIEESIKEKRLSEIMLLQKEISYNNNKKRIGKEYEIIVEDISDDEKYFVCRSMFEAPDVDGRILIPINEKNASLAVIGEFAKCLIKSCNEYDLYADII